MQIVGLDGERLAPEAETTLYRIVQEALTNIAKYAHATHVSVLLERHDGQINAIVEDNGCGSRSSNCSALARSKTDWVSTACASGPN